MPRYLFACAQLGKRDYVTGRMWKHAKGPYRLILNTAARKQINWHCEHYASRGVCDAPGHACIGRTISAPTLALLERQQCVRVPV